MEIAPNLVAVQSNVAASLLIDGLFEQAVARLEEPLGPATERALAAAEDPRVARLGYLARTIELERFAVARGPVAWLAQHAVDRPEDSIADRARGLADQEPLDKPAPASGAPSWRVPGPGGHVRHFLAIRAIGDAPAERKRSWAHGFFVRCCEDTPGVRVDGASS